jgi:GT2 family glycosyltransferase
VTQPALAPERTILLVANHYKNADEVRAFVRHAASLSLPAGWGLRIAICDNSDDWVGDAPHPCATMLRPRANLGYYGGCAHALAQWQARTGTLPAWIGAVNTDLELDARFFVTLVEQVPPHIAVVAPAVQLPDGTHQNPYLRERPSRTRMLWMRAVFRASWLAWAWTLGHEVLRRMRPHSRVDGTRKRETIYAPHGSIVMFRREFFAAGGRLEFGGFMYGEELHVAEQARRLGFSVLYEPGCHVLHNAHAVVGKVPSALNRRWRSESSDFIWSAYFGAG